MERTEVVKVAYCDFCEEKAVDKCWWCSRDLCHRHSLQVQISFSPRDDFQRYDACPDCQETVKRLISEVLEKICIA